MRRLAHEMHELLLQELQHLLDRHEGLTCECSYASVLRTTVTVQHRLRLIVRQ